MSRTLAFDWSILSTAEFQMVTKIIGVAMRQPDLIVAPRGEPYMHRWHVIPRNDKANVYLHIQVADDAPDKHDHPYDNQSVILSGGYIEEMVYRNGAPYEVARVAGNVIHRKAADLHRLRLLPPFTHTITLFSTGPRYHPWGYQTPSGRVPYEDLVATNGNISTRKEAA